MRLRSGSLHVQIDFLSRQVPTVQPIWLCIHVPVHENVLTTWFSLDMNDDACLALSLTGVDPANATGVGSSTSVQRHTCGWQHTLDKLKAPANMQNGSAGQAITEEQSNGHRNIAQRLIDSLLGK